MILGHYREPTRGQRRRRHSQCRCRPIREPHIPTWPEVRRTYDFLAAGPRHSHGTRRLDRRVAECGAGRRRRGVDPLGQRCLAPDARAPLTSAPEARQDPVPANARCRTRLPSRRSRSRRPTSTSRSNLRAPAREADRPRTRWSRRNDRKHVRGWHVGCPRCLVNRSACSRQCWHWHFC
jgi:hypothetical protein